MLLAQLDGKIPNLALMRISAHHRALGDEVQLSVGAQFERGLWDHFDKVYGSCLFRKSIPLAERLKRTYPDAIIGARPYPMPYVRTKELVGFQRWVIGAYDKRIPWGKWEAANYEPRELGMETNQEPFEFPAEHSTNTAPSGVDESASKAETV